MRIGTFFVSFFDYFSFLLNFFFKNIYIGDVFLLFVLLFIFFLMVCYTARYNLLPKKKIIFNYGFLRGLTVLELLTDLIFVVLFLIYLFLPVIYIFDNEILSVDFVSIYHYFFITLHAFIVKMTISFNRNLLNYNFYFLFVFLFFYSFFTFFFLLLNVFFFSFYIFIILLVMIDMPKESYINYKRNLKYRVLSEKIKKK